MKEQWTDWIWAVVIIGLWFIGLTYAQEIHNLKEIKLDMNSYQDFPRFITWEDLIVEGCISISAFNRLHKLESDRREVEEYEQQQQLNNQDVF